MPLDDLIVEMKEKMNRYDLTEEIAKANIGEYRYGVSYVPCDWVYKYLVELKELRDKNAETN